jgi:acetoin utilization deacetylase AcuC-like enzyme
MSKTGFQWDEKYVWFDSRGYADWLPPEALFQPMPSPETAEGKRRFKNLLDAAGITPQLVPIPSRMATREEIERLHDPAYIDRIKALSDTTGGDAGEETPFGPGGYEIALLAAGGAMNAVKAVVGGDCRNAYALVRPPGHHAERDLGRGYCIFANTALAARHAQMDLGLARVAVVDWDVHHGNGTEHLFYDDPSVLAISLHQDRYFPLDSGFVEENGEGDGAGANINVPLPAGSGVAAYTDAFERVVIPALERFSPDLIIVASGLDASALDPLARNQMHSDGYRNLTQQLLAVTDKVGAKIVFTHEGGYSAAYVPFCGLAVLEELTGHRTPVEDPFLPIFTEIGGQDLQPHQAAVIDQAAALVERVPAKQKQ